MDKNTIINNLSEEPIEEKLKTMAPIVFGYISDASLFYSKAIEVEPTIFNDCKKSTDVYNKANEVVFKLAKKYSKSSVYGVVFNDGDEFEKIYKDFLHR